MIAAAKDWLKQRWPRLRLRTILFATLFFVAALPGFGAIFLRVYENSLVRQTEAELVAQGAALAAAAAVDWPAAAGGAGAGRARPAVPRTTPQTPRPAEPAEVDLSTAAILPERPAPAVAPPPSADARAAAARIAPVIDKTGSTTMANIILLDRDGRLVAGRGPAGSYAALPEVAAALAGTPRTILRRNGAYRAVYRFEWLSRAAAIRVHHARPVIVNGRVVGVLLLSRSARALFKGIYDDRGKIVLGILVILGLLVVLSGIISRGITRPIERLGAATRAVASGRGAIPDVPPTAAIEIQGLYADFATMAAAIDRRSRYLRDMAYAMSHEFKTPLAGIRGAIELLHDHRATMTESDRGRFLGNIDADAGRLAQLVTRLLDLARADMAQAAPSASTALEPVVARVADAQPRLETRAHVPASLPRVAVPSAALETVFSTLLENSRLAGARQATLVASEDGGYVQVLVADDGPGIAPADRLRLFEPFFTTRRAAGGTGLGLTIARSLLDAYGATIALAEGDATVFVVRLPVTR
ncbi:HAMP domain-containing sensor histidine kinase [Sphingomonas sp.]|uniref:sensor histidine kinase n=1 Tax=Sphingomonas sp. TaxID=28214 RepID=UPI002585F3CC|nr:HAMP domain-containing sensor histidine kinase [Sphingomonas sp.]